MTATRRISISALPRGHEFNPEIFHITADQVRVYLEATGDGNDYDVTPPMCATALGLAALQQQTSLPDGALHTGQEIEHVASIPADVSVTLSGRIAQRSERQGFVMSVIEFELSAEGRTSIRARTTIVAPAGRA